MLGWTAGCFDHVYTVTPRAVLNVTWDGTLVHDTAEFVKKFKKLAVAIEIPVQNFNLPTEWSTLPPFRLWPNVRRHRSSGRVPAWNCVTGALTTLKSAGIDINPNTLTPDELFARLSIYLDENTRIAERVAQQRAGHP